MAYLLWLWSQGVVIVQEWNNTLAYILLLVVLGYVFVNYVIYHFHLKRNKVTLFILWLLLIVIGDGSLVADATAEIYVGDFVKIIWVVFMIAGPAKLFLSQKKAQEIKESSMEVIEV